MKIGLFADTHVGRCIPRAIGELRRQAYRHAFRQVINTFIEENVDYVVHAGDLFEKRSMTPEDSVFVKEELQRLINSIHEKQGKEVVIFVIRGNHDGTPENSALDYIKHPLAQYLKVVGDDILEEEEEIWTDGKICLVGVGYHPYIARKFENLKPIIQRSFVGKQGVKLLVLHNFLEGYHDIPPGVPKHNTLALTDLEEINADLIVAGHYHTMKAPLEQNRQIILTPGATEAVDLSDEGPFGAHIFEEGTSTRFVSIQPLHEIRSVKVSSEGAVKPTKWFVQKALVEAESYTSGLQTRNVNGVLRIVLSGLTDEDPYNIEPALEFEIAKLKESSQRLLHVELAIRVQNVQQPIIFPTLGGGNEFAVEVLKPLGDSAQESMKIVEEVGIALDEKASQKTGLLTGLDRASFVKRWIDVLEKIEVTS